MRLLYYKLPSEDGENILLGDVPLNVESELAILIESTDLSYPRFLIERMDSETHVEETTDEDDLYFYASGDNFDAILPFPTIEDAYEFLRGFDKLSRELDALFDEG